ncbi:G-protein coupled receptor moody-like [Gigantopelta aegis]|uniref:G-protein coupled receptor moody-like n=1 Tax=Gigantopelta aegis TaxID=1735272 RepID=UPI001B889A74|nr:G-protein coupled receptor moody-like [Gigantopelta aegis]
MNVIPVNNYQWTMVYNISELSVNISSSGATEDLRIVQLVFALILSVVGLTGNSFTIYRIISESLYRQVCNKYILNLSINNLITCVIVIPILGVSFYKQKWIFGEGLCYFYPYLMHTTLCSETNALLLITINRYCIVVHPLLYNKLYNRKYFNVFLIGSSWLVYLVIQTLPLAKIWGKFEYNKHKHYCTYADDSETKTFIASLCALILLTNLPIHVFCYGSILWKYKRSKKRMSIVQSSNQRRERRKDAREPMNIVQSSNPPRECRKDAREPKMNMSLMRMIIVIILCFTLTHTPFLAVNAIDPTLTLTGITVYMVMAYIALCHTAFNPIVYALMNKQICNNMCRPTLCCQ